jgi:galactokinase
MHCDSLAASRTLPMSKPEMPEPARAALAAYRARLAEAGDTRLVVVAWVPGRVNLIGEHTDYNDGFVLPIAVDRVVALAGRVTEECDVRLYSAHYDAFAAFSGEREALAIDLPHRVPPWARYVRGVLAELADLPGVANTPGFDAAIAGDVPLGGGMSSSAALEVVAATFAAALGGPAMGPMETARLCQRAEWRGVGVECGIMDQAAACLGRPGAALLLDCRSLAYEYVPFDLPDMALAVFDTGVPHTLAESGYNERRRQCGEAVALLGEAIAAAEPGRSVAALRDVTRDDLARYIAALPDLLLRRARHVVMENARVLEAVEALRAGDAAHLGALLDISHASLRDDYQVSCAELDAAVEIAGSIPGTLGARMMGAGFGGSALILTEVEALHALEEVLAAEYPRRTGRVGALHVCRVSGGPGSVMVEVQSRP